MKRRLHVYCVGLGKTGTRSMDGIFSKCYRSEHEPFGKELATVILAREKGIITKHEFRQYVLYLDRKKQLEFNSSFFNAWQLDIFVKEFPEAKFILTIRDCFSWVNSVMNDLMNEDPDMTVVKQFINGSLKKNSYQYAKEETILREEKLYPLDCLFSFWVKINNSILSKVPKERLLVVQTNEISRKLGEISDFLEILPSTLDVTKTHLNKSHKHKDVLAKIKKEYLLNKANVHCKGLMDQYFPGLIETYN